MANPRHLVRLQEGPETWNAWRETNGDLLPDLSEAKLQRAELSGANLSHVNLSEADLTEANLSGADLSDADLAKARLFAANLSKARLVRTHLYGAKLESADLTSAVLARANLEYAVLRNANLEGASIVGTFFHTTDLTGTRLDRCVLTATRLANVDLSVATGLDQTVHFGPSSIGIDTMYLSKGQIPDGFLRAAGIPESFVAFAKSLVANPIEFYSCFICYSTKDQEFADRLYNDLHAKGVRCWFAPHDAQRGRKLHEQIDEAIRIHEKLLLILSPDSMQSEWVKTEIAKARQRELRERVQLLFPISLVPYSTIRDWECFDADTGKDSAREIREYLIADFSKWKDHDSYGQQFEILVRDLQSKHTNRRAS